MKRSSNSTPRPLQKNKIITHLKHQGAYIAESKEKADYVISTKSLELQPECEAKYMKPLLLVRKLKQNGSDLPLEFERQFKV